MCASMTQLDKAIRLATHAHFGQKDRAGAPYILHPIRVMMNVTTIEGKIVGICHDIIEDTYVTKTDLIKMKFPDVCISAIDCMTRREHESYDSYIQHVISNKLASKCKLEDMKDNSNIYRLQKIHKRQLDMISKYHKATFKILDAYPELASRFELIS